ncbi:MAG: UDP-3-O-acyl-N-acetylglucosamine deacetylase [Pseudomonadota bacterium]
MRNTVAGAVKCRGVGLHTGHVVSMRILPAPSGQGILFRRVDLPLGRGDIPARYDFVADTQLCSKLGNGYGATVGTVEHLMAALAGAGVADATVELDGPEVPVMDGSSRPFLEALSRVGLRAQAGAARAIRILAPVTVEDEGRVATLTPADRFKVSFEIDFDDMAIGHQAVELDLTRDAFTRQLADCRTFGRLAEVDALRRMGLARGGSLDNAIVIDGGVVLNPEGLRRSDEFVRHKALDAVGDLALAGAPIIGGYRGVRAGHDMTNRLLRALFATPNAWAWSPLPASAMRLPATPHQVHGKDAMRHPTAVAV